jgi:hypothetical protein
MLKANEAAQWQWSMVKRGMRKRGQDVGEDKGRTKGLAAGWRVSTICHVTRPEIS